MLVDSHCHLDFPELSEDGDAVIARARAAGVGRMVTICTKITEFARVRAVSERYDDVWCTVGIHPHEAASEAAVTAQELIGLADHPRVVGIGETGLDFYYEHSLRETQESQFRAHIAAARATGLPLIIHSREADEDMIRILRDESEAGAFPAVLHCFSSGPELAWAAIDLGHYVSLSGIVTFKKAEDLRDIAQALPLERLLVETDSPYLAPVPHRGKTNEPAFVVHTAGCLADLRGLSAQEIATATTENFFRLFTKVPRPDATNGAAP